MTLLATLTTPGVLDQPDLRPVILIAVLAWPGLALLGANAQGKTNFLEAVYYPVLFRSFRGAPDQEVARFGGPREGLRRTVGRAAPVVRRADFVAHGRSGNLRGGGFA